MSTPSPTPCYDPEGRTGNASIFYQQRSQRRRAQQQASASAQGPPVIPTVAQIVHHERLLEVFEHLKREAGQAPGPDGITYRDLGRSEAAALLRQVSKAIRAGCYRPGPCRIVPIPKPNGGGHRELRLRSIVDRVVAAALNQALRPYWESVFLDGSMGFRPNRGCWDLLAQLERGMLSSSRTVLAIDDVKKTFDNIVIDQVLEDHRRHIVDPELLSLIHLVLQGEEDRVIGIDQGNAYSPTALNIRLHHAHDLAMRQDHHPFWFRYADNLVYLTQSVPEGTQMLKKAHQILSNAGLSIKGEDGPPMDLVHGSVQLLGFTLSWKGNNLRIGLGNKALGRIRLELQEAHTAEDPPKQARRIMQGWIDYLGPAFESDEETDVLNTLIRTADQLGFHETGSNKEMRTLQRKAWRQWKEKRNQLLYQAAKQDWKQDNALSGVGGLAIKEDMDTIRESICQSIKTYS